MSTTFIRFENFLTKFCPPFIIFFCLFGNMIVIKIFWSKRFAKLGCKRFLQLQAAFEMLSSLLIISYFVKSTFGIELLVMSSFLCKLLRFFQFLLPAISSCFLVCVSVERVFSILYPSRLLFKNTNFQIALSAAIIGFEILYYSPAIVGIDIKNYQNLTNICSFKTHSYKTIISTMDVINSTLIPFLVMFLSSISIIYSINYTRKRVMQKSATLKDRKRFKRDLQFSFTIIFINIGYMIFNLPICVLQYLGEYDLLVFVALDVFFYLQYVYNLFMHISFNSLFRKELLTLFRFRKSK